MGWGGTMVIAKRWKNDKRGWGGTCKDRKGGGVGG